MEYDNNEKMIILADKLSDLGYQLLDKIEVHENERDKIIVSILTNKILNDFDACIVLSKQGFVDQIFEIIRVMLDKIFIMRALIIEPNRVDDFFKHQELQREGIIKKAFKLNIISDDEKEVYLAGLSARKYCSVSKWAEAANMSDTYDREYTLFSNYTHFSLKIIEDCLVYDNNSISAIDLKPKEEMRNAGLCTACYYALLTVDSICQEFGIGSDKYRELEKEWATLSIDYYQILD